MIGSLWFKKAVVSTSRPQQFCVNVAVATEPQTETPRPGGVGENILFIGNVPRIIRKIAGKILGPKLCQNCIGRDMPVWLCGIPAPSEEDEGQCVELRKCLCAGPPSVCPVHWPEKNSLKWLGRFWRISTKVQQKRPDVQSDGQILRSKNFSIAWLVWLVTNANSFQRQLRKRSGKCPREIHCAVAKGLPQVLQDVYILYTVTLKLSYVYRYTNIYIYIYLYIYIVIK